MKYYCNPININYRYQFEKSPQNGERMQCWREAADPSMILFKGRYYIFASMTLGIWVSDDLVHWENHRLSDELPLYDYAPDVRVIGEYVYFCASRIEEHCDRYRTKDILHGPYEKIPGNFPFWDPNLFLDDDGRVYFYWGCSALEPIYGTELCPETMLPIGERQGLIAGHPEELGYERIGENNSQMPGETTNRPFIEGAWMDKHDGRYYLQYAFAGTEYNTYGDGVYVGEKPLGPFRRQRSNPYSYQPGGFFPGAGHGSTMADKGGNLWHTSTMRISRNHIFERRVGLWPAGFDADGELFCNQRFGDWPRTVPAEGGESKIDPWANPKWMLLSAGKKVTSSSSTAGYPAANASEENVQTWWKPIRKSQDEWLMMDLGKAYEVHAIQINFADDAPDIPCPDKMHSIVKARYIADENGAIQWQLFGSLDGVDWFVIADKSKAKTDLSHDFIVNEAGFSARYLKLTDMRVPYEQIPCISGLRVFGIGAGKKPTVPQFQALRINDLDMNVEIFPDMANVETAVMEDDTRALGYNIVWGYAPEKLYHSWMLFGTKLRIGALVKGEEYYVRVDAFNENGITEGKLKKLKD